MCFEKNFLRSDSFFILKCLSLLLQPYHDGAAAVTLVITTAVEFNEKKSGQDNSILSPDYSGVERCRFKNTGAGSNYLHIDSSNTDHIYNDQLDNIT